MQFNKSSEFRSKVKAIGVCQDRQTLLMYVIFWAWIRTTLVLLPTFQQNKTPSRKLLHNNKTFKWSTECEVAFANLKIRIADDRVRCNTYGSCENVITHNWRSRQANWLCILALIHVKQDYWQLGREALESTGFITTCKKGALYLWQITNRLHEIPTKKNLSKTTSVRHLLYA